MGGILRIPQQLPKSQREWEQFTRQLNALIRRNDTRHYQIDASMARASDQRLLPMVSFGNVGSVQSVSPLSATGGTATADISIAAHTLQTDFGVIAYNAGSISGLALSTTYFVYADDPDHSGGAVTYLATTNRAAIAAVSGRYLVGNITTPAAMGSGSGSGGGGGGWLPPGVDIP